MENCTIYSHYIDFEKVTEIVRRNLPQATVSVQENGLNKSLNATIKGGLFGKTKQLNINYRQRANPSYKLEQVECDLTQNLAGMANFIQSLPAHNEELRDKFMYKVLSANCEMAFMAEPEITQDFESVLKQIALELDCFVFAQPNRIFQQAEGQYFADKNLNMILDTAGNSIVADIEVNIESKYYDQPAIDYTEDQLARKEQSEAFLAAHEVKINKKLPCIPDSSSVQLRELQDVIDRAYALLVIAVKGEGIEQEYLERTVTDKRITSFSPQERYIYEAAELNDQERAYASWRYESLYAILWALGKMEELKYPNEICDVQAVVSQIFQPTREEFEASVSLRTKEEILNELDKTYRMNWACVDARIHKQAVGGEIMEGVVYERHYMLNWLTQYQNADWDNVQTPT